MTPNPNRSRRAGLLGLIMLTVGLVGVGVNAQGAAEDDTSPDLSLRPSPDRGKEEVMRLLARKERLLIERERLVEKKEADLRAAQVEVEDRIEELQGLRDEVRAQLAELDEDREARITHLVKMFESMRGKQAAGVLEKTEPDIALEVLERMKKDQAGKVLAAMDPTIAGQFASVIGEAALTRGTK